MNKMRAVKDFESMDGDFKEGATFQVNDERAFILMRQGRAERAPVEPAVDEQAHVEQPQAASDEHHDNDAAAPSLQKLSNE